MTHTNLLSNGKINGLELKNRIVLAAMGSNFAEEDGSCGERIQAYYEERAAGGAGLLVMETATVDWPAGSTMPRMVGFSDQRFLPGLRQLADRVHKHGAKIAAQLNHGGKVAQEDVAAGRPVLVPSLPTKGASDMFQILTQQELGNFVKAAGPDGKGPRYKVMDKQDIKVLVEKFTQSAKLAMQAGFDAIEIHAGHGYVLSSFLSPAVNKRDDEYGGSPENRARLLCEIITAIRVEVGPAFPILVRLDAKEFRVEGGITLEDSLITASLAEAAGADALDVSAYGNTAIGIAFTEAPLVHEPAGFVEFARQMKQGVSIPIIAVGRIELDVADKGLAQGVFDFVAMGRKLLADPHLPNKLAAGKTDDIRPCIYCYVCVSKIFINQPMSCAVNPACGREHEYGVIASDKPGKRILVIGGGPAGLEAARVATERGHSVSLWERESDLGGTARIAALPYEPNGRLVKHLVKQVKDSAVAISTGKTADVAQVKALAPDTVLVATGANRQGPDIPGKAMRHVFDGEELRGLLFGSHPGAIAKLSPWQRLVVTAGRLSQLLRSIKALRQLSKLWMPLNKRIVLIGGGLVGLELAEYLVERGRSVTILEPGASMGAELSIVRRARVIHELRQAGVQLVTNASIEKIGETAVHYQVKDTSNTAQADNVIICLGAKSNTGFADKLTEAGLNTHTIGDCHEVGYIEGAILSGRRAALDL